MQQVYGERPPSKQEGRKLAVPRTPLKDHTPQYISLGKEPIIHGANQKELQQHFMSGKSAQQRRQQAAPITDYVPNNLQFAGNQQLKPIPGSYKPVAPGRNSNWYDEPKAQVPMGPSEEMESEYQPEIIDSFEESEEVDLKLYTLLQDGSIIFTTNNLDDLEAMATELVLQGMELERLVPLKRMNFRSGIFVLGEHAD